MKKLSWALVLGLAITGCVNEDEEEMIDPNVEPVSAELLCAEVASVVCAADRDCCPTGSPETDAEGRPCLEAQLERCEALLEPLVDDPRLAYSEARGGELLVTLRAAAEGCAADAFGYADVAALFLGTGAEAADCTPPSASRSDLRVSALSCEGAAACRLHLRADGSPLGVCEAREDSTCSHPYDCESGQFCNLPDSWAPGMWGQCQPLRTDGWACASDLECASQHCAEGMCRPAAPSRFCLAETYTAVVLDDEPTGFWRLGDPAGTSAADSSGQGAEARLVGGVTRLAEGALERDPDGAIGLDGMGAHVRLPTLAESDARTLELWLHFDEAGADTLVESAELEASLRISRTAEGSIVIVASRRPAEEDEEGEEEDELEPLRLETDEGLLEAERWHHLAITYDGERLRLYLDGDQVGSLDGDLLLGEGAELCAGGCEAETFAGALDEIALYDEALSRARLRRRGSTAGEGPSSLTFPMLSWLE